MKYLNRNQQHAQDLHAENYEELMKEIKEDLTDTPCFRTTKLPMGM